MIPIHPISVKTCRTHYGKPVCVIMQDGTRLIGTLSRVEKGKLILNEEPVMPMQTNHKKTRARKRFASGITKKVREVKTDAFSAPAPAYPFGGGRVVIDTAVIALLFPLS